eukprot:67625_1
MQRDIKAIMDTNLQMLVIFIFGLLLVSESISSDIPESTYIKGTKSNYQVDEMVVSNFMRNVDENSSIPREIEGVIYNFYHLEYKDAFKITIPFNSSKILDDIHILADNFRNAETICLLKNDSQFPSIEIIDPQIVENVLDDKVEIIVRSIEDYSYFMPKCGTITELRMKPSSYWQLIRWKWLSKMFMKIELELSSGQTLFLTWATESLDIVQKVRTVTFTFSNFGVCFE